MLVSCFDIRLYQFLIFLFRFFLFVFLLSSTSSTMYNLYFNFITTRNGFYSNIPQRQFSLNWKQRFKMRNEIIKKELLQSSKSYVLLPRPYNTTTILLMGIGSHIASAYCYLLQFSEVNCHFFSKSKGFILERFRKIDNLK